MTLHALNAPAPLAAEVRRGHAGTIATAALFFVGALLCFPYLFGSSFGPKLMAVFATIWTGADLVAQGATSRLARSIAAGCSLALYAVSAYGAVLCVAVLGWSLPPWATALLAATTLATAATARRERGRLRVPAVLTIGLLMTTTLSGWWREGGRVHCDDYLRLKEQSDVAVLIPSLQGLAACEPGVTLPLDRYPRHVWQSPDGKTLVFTTQREPYAGETADGFDGSVCSAEPASGRIRCIGKGKGEQAVEVGNDRLIVMNPEGEDGAMYAFRRDDVFGDPVVVKIGRAGTGFYDPTLDVLYVIGDDANMLTPVRGSDLKAEPAVPLRPIILADVGPYDTKRRVGLLCGAVGPLGAVLNGGRSYLATKFRAQPLGIEGMGGSLLAWFAVSFGCDWDRATDRVFVALPNLAAVAEVDFETGRLLSIGRTEIGLRMLRYDAEQHRLYAGNFLRGYVVELDADSKRQLRRWFVGRFARDVRLTRDRTALLVASNLGIVRISL